MLVIATHCFHQFPCNSNLIQDNFVLYFLDCLCKTLKHFDNGEYSKFKLEDKKRILDFYSVTSNDKFGPAGVLYKKEWRRLEIEKKIDMKLPEDAELSSIADIEQETYFNKYKTQDESEDITR